MHVYQVLHNLLGKTLLKQISVQHDRLLLMLDNIYHANLFFAAKCKGVSRLEFTLLGSAPALTSCRVEYPMRAITV